MNPAESIHRFRAWDGKQYIYFDLTTVPENIADYDEKDIDSLATLRNEAYPAQDKNNKDIYHNDLVAGTRYSKRVIDSVNARTLPPITRRDIEVVGNTREGVTEATDSVMETFANMLDEDPDEGDYSSEESSSSEDWDE